MQQSLAQLIKGGHLHDAPEAQGVAGGHGVVVGGNSDSDAEHSRHADGCCDLQQVHMQHLQPHCASAHEQWQSQSWTPVTQAVMDAVITS